MKIGKWNVKADWNKQQIGLYLLGCVLFSFGAKFFIDSHLGVDPLDVLVLGIVKHTGLLIGVVSGAIAILFLAIWSFWNWKIPPITPFITMFFVGSMIDLWNFLYLQNYTQALMGPYALLSGALILVSYGSSLIIMSSIGIRIMDLVAITIVHKWNWSFFSAKMFFEIGFITSGWLLGGPVGIGSVAFVCIVGPCIVQFMSYNTKYFGIPNYGLRKPEDTFDDYPDLPTPEEDVDYKNA